MLENSNFELRDVVSSKTSNKKLTRCRSFHFRYLELCRGKNIVALSEIRSKNNAKSVLDFYGDKLNVNDWLIIIEALYYDLVLQTLAIRMRKTFGTVLEHLDTEKKAKLFRQKSVIYTKFVFSGVVNAISNCIKFNKNLVFLNLEGLPLNDKYVESIAKALSSNQSIKEISFSRSNIGDKGCETLCNTIKYLANIEKVNMSECELTDKGAGCVADMIKIQKISRYTEGWQRSLRYREVDPETMTGLRSISLSRNPQIGDDGISTILEVLKEDVWIKFVDMENCGLSDRAANLILDCLEINNYIIDFNVSNNRGISKFLLRSIREQLGKEDEDQILRNSQEELVPGPNGVFIKRRKVTVTALKEEIKTLEEQLAFEKDLRKKAEILTEKLNQQIVAYEKQLADNMNATIPEGYVLVQNESLQSIIKERNDLQKPFASMMINNDSKLRNNKCLAQKKQRNYSEEDNRSAPAHLPCSLNNFNTELEQRKSLKVRKVKSEIKYGTTANKDSIRNQNIQSKSDHRFLHHSELPVSTIHFETNIGDTMANVVSDRSGNDSSKTITNLPFAYKTDKQFCKNLRTIELDDLSMPSTRSANSGLSPSNSDTIRNELDCQPKVIIRQAKHVPISPNPKVQDPKRESAYFHNVARNLNLERSRSSLSEFSET